MTVQELIDTFRKSPEKLVTFGSITTFGDYIGRPGDTADALIDIQLAGDTLTLRFSNRSVVTIEGPEEVEAIKEIDTASGFIINGKLVINKCRKVRYDFDLMTEKRFYREYFYVNGMLNFKTNFTVTGADQHEEGKYPAFSLLI